MDVSWLFWKKEEIPEKSEFIEDIIARKIEKAKQLKLDEIIVDLYDEIQHYPSWINRPNSQDSVKEIVSEAKYLDEDSDQMEIVFRDKKYVFKNKEKISEMDSSSCYGDVEVYSEGKKVFAVTKHAEYNPYACTWKPLSIEAFIEGDWIDDIREMYSLVKKQNESKKAKQYQAELERKKKDFGL